ncbi:alpha/beta hydrolase [Candidatus Oleimmundimicrobium sp.]|uniref:dienelactone hydrolase family protein n=1 Tax=Candidatus Oleimmundimicrobium sp. TaxID=3060597 RepID=UPI0027162F3B|nr:alpha/beta hydrolase [Candidatus Oleimmundimicrobium sp.]MDO8886276.1 alpha/beta hydrolase [Candidatus Oleimmundimicrobium sp.]
MVEKRVSENYEKLVEIPINSASLNGMLVLPEGAKGIVLFAHGSGSSRLSPRNNFVATVLQKAGIGTLLFDLLTEEEDTVYSTRFDINLLTERLILATNWLKNQSKTKDLQIGYFGASTGAAAALQATAGMGSLIFAIVSRGGRPDLAMSYLSKVEFPTLLIVGGFDESVIGLNQQAYDELTCEKKLVIVPGATHLFEEPGALEEVARLAVEWFVRHLTVKVV